MKTEAVAHLIGAHLRQNTDRSSLAAQIRTCNSSESMIFVTENVEAALGGHGVPVQLDETLDRRLHGGSQTAWILEVQQ